MAWEAGKDLSIEDVEVAPPKANEVRIEIYYTGVCHTGSFAVFTQREGKREWATGKTQKAFSPPPLSSPPQFWSNVRQMRTRCRARIPRGPSP